MTDNLKELIRLTQTASKTWYRPGLVFKAHPKAQGHQEICRSEKRILAVDGTVIDVIRELNAEFGVYGTQYRYIDPMTEQEEIGSEFRGGYFNLDQQAEDKGWDDDEKEIVARHMLRMVESGRSAHSFSLYSAPKAAPPWSTYDSTPHGKIAELAALTGAAVEALVYEEQNKNRKSVVEALRAEVEKAQAETQDDGDLVAE